LTIQYNRTIMRSMKFIGQVMFMFLVVVLSAQAVPPVLNYAGQVAVNGQPFEGEGLFKFALVNANGNITYWSNDGTSLNGSEPQASVKAPVSGGLYSLLLGNTAIPGMGAINPQVFAQHGDAKLRVWFSDGVNGFQQLSPDRPFASVPYAFSAGTAQSATIADGSINKAMLGSDVIADLNKTITITRDMLPQDVRADLNATIGMNRLSPEVSAKLDQNDQFDNNDTTMVAFRVRKENNQTGLTNSDHFKVTWDSTNFDHNADFDLSQDAFIVPETGLYAISSSARFSFVETGVFAHLIIKRNNESLNSGVAIRAGGDSGYYISSVSALIDANKSDNISILAGQSGSSQPISIIGSESTYFEGFKISGNSLDTIKPNSINKAMLGSDVIADLNATIGLNRLSAEVTAKLDQNGSGGSGVVAGSLISLPYGQSAPTGYSLYQQGTPKELVWEEKSPVSVARYAYDGVEVLNGKIYFVGGYDGSAKNTAERYDPTNNTWETIASLSVERWGVASAVLNGNLYAIGGQDSSSISSSSVEIYLTTANAWVNGPSLPTPVRHSTAIIINEKMYLVGGIKSGLNINQVLCFDPSSNQWSAKANMPTARHGHKLVWFENRIWAIGGHDGSHSNKVESYDPLTDSWQTEASLKTVRHWPVVWVASSKIYVGGGNGLSSIETYNPTIKEWSNAGNFPENKFHADAVVLNDKIYVVAGATASDVYSNKVYAADLNASREGVYDLYRKDGNASAGTPIVQAEVADGSVTTAKIASNTITTSDLSEQILKYLRPEITSEPQAQAVYADANVSISVSAEGKYLTYQWKKDGVDLTGETNATLTITDANATLHDGNYSVVVSNDFGSIESDLTEVLVKDGILNGLVGWWKFDETNGTVAYDSSGNGNDGNLTNGPTWTTGKIGGAISLDGTNDYVEVSSRKWNIENLLSISLWYYNLSSENSTAFSLGRAEYNDEILLFLDSTAFRFYNHMSGGNWVQLNGVSSNSSWYHFAGVVDGGFAESQMKVFLQGTELVKNYVISGSPALLSDAQDRMLRIGLRVNNDAYYNGFIDDVRIYDRALSAAEVQALYNMGQ
jgi:N-acetylneuraminic acid mutarotase